MRQSANTRSTPRRLGRWELEQDSVGTLVAEAAALAVSCMYLVTWDKGSRGAEREREREREREKEREREDEG